MTNVDRSKLPRHKLEELKRKEDEALTKEVYEEFVATFDDQPKIGKTFVRGEIVNPDEKIIKKESTVVAKPKLYKPTPTLWKPPGFGAAKSDPLKSATAGVIKNEMVPSSSTGTQSILDQAKRTAQEKAKKIMEEAMKSRPQKPGAAKKKVDAPKPKSNLELFKEELKRVQDERNERRKIRQQLKDQLGITDPETADKIAGLNDPYANTYESDPNTTNLFLSNLSPKITEEELCKIFGKYGPLASVKVMWARTDDEKARGYLCGFVAYMTRIDGERAMAGERGRIIHGMDMKMGWGKCVNIPPYPVYIPPTMMELTLPPPPSGLPFNAQPRQKDLEQYSHRWPLPPPNAPPPVDLEQRMLWDKMIRNAVVKVVIPTERPLLCIVHRMIEFVVREGPIFEAIIMNREMQNPMFRFLFDNQIPAHVYYRWKLYSILQGDSPTKWDTREFRMFQNGSIWRPPSVNFYAQGMPTELYVERLRPKSGSRFDRGGPDDDLESPSEFTSTSPSRDDSSRRSKSQSRSRSRSRSPGSKHSPVRHSVRRGQLSRSQRDRFEDMLRGLAPDRNLIADAMYYCVQHADAAEEIVDCICESLSIPETPLHKKVARLYLIADILANCSAKVPNVSYFRKFFWTKLETIFENIGQAYKSISARLKAEQFKTRVISCFRAWEETAIYPVDFLIKLQNIFLGLAPMSAVLDIDGVPIEKYIDDGGGFKETVEPESSVSNTASLVADYDDLDGVPIGETAHVKSAASPEVSAPVNKKTSSGAFVRSKWEEVEPDIVEQQAMTTSKWEQLEKLEESSEKVTSSHSALFASAYSDDIDGIPMDDNGPETPQVKLSHSKSTEMTEKKRQRLREIEVKVMSYQDDLEASKGSNKYSASFIQQKVQAFRERLLRELESQDNGFGDKHRSNNHEDNESRRKKRRSRSRSRSSSPRRNKHSKRSKSKSRSPRRHKDKKHKREKNK